MNNCLLVCDFTLSYEPKASIAKKVTLMALAIACFATSLFLIISSLAFRGRSFSWGSFQFLPIHALSLSILTCLSGIVFLTIGCVKLETKK